MVELIAQAWTPRHEDPARPRRRAHLDRAPLVPARAPREAPTPRATATCGAKNRQATTGQTTSRAPRLGAVAGTATGLVPQELLRPAACAELRLDRAAPDGAMARRRRCPGPGANITSSRRSWRSGSTAGSPGSASTWRSPSSRATARTVAPRPAPPCGVRSATGWTPPIPTLSSFRKARNPAPSHRWRSMRTSSSSSTRSTPACSTTTSRARCPSMRHASRTSTPPVPAAPAPSSTRGTSPGRSDPGDRSSCPPPTTTSTDCAAGRGPPSSSGRPSRSC